MGSYSYLLNNEEIDRKVKSQIGNYALGHLRNNEFVPKYVGRSDSNLNRRLKGHVGEKYKRFKFSYASSKLAAWKKECSNYHDWIDQLDNEIHPARPVGVSKVSNPCPARKRCTD